MFQHIMEEEIFRTLLAEMTSTEMWLHLEEQDKGPAYEDQLRAL